MVKKVKFYFLFGLVTLFSVSVAQDSTTNIIQTTPSSLNEYYVLANKHLKNENYAKAIGFYKKFMWKNESTTSKELLISLYTNISKCYLHVGITDEALKYTLLALKLSEEGKVPINIARSLNSLGVIKMELNDFNGALDDYEKALLYIENTDSVVLESFIFNNIGVIYGNLNEFDKSLEYFSLSLILKREIGDKQKIIRTLNNISNAHMYKGNYDIALTNLKESIALSDNSSEHALANTYAILADLYLRQQYYGRAKLEIIKSLKISKAKELNHLVKESYNFLSSIYAIEGDYKESLKYKELYLEIYNTIETAKSAKKIAQLSTLYEIDKKEKEIKLLQKDNQLKEEKISTSRKVILFFIGFLLLVILFSIIVFMSYKRLKMANDSLVKINLDIVASEKKKKNESVTKIDDSASKNESRSAINIEQKKYLEKKIIHLFEEEKIFLDQDLTLIKLSELLDTNKSYASKVINDFTDKNYNNFVNEYRVNEARKLFAERENWNYTIEFIAFRVGFKSKSTFNIAFKKFTGITPSYFLSSIKRDAV